MANEGGNVIIINHERTKRTKWSVIYVDEAITYEEGEFHPTYGFYVGRPFQIRNKASGRLMDIDVSNKKIIIKT